MKVIDRAMTPRQLRAARDSLGMTQAQLGEAITVDWHHISLMERGERRITPRTAKQVAALVAANTASAAP